MAENPNKISQIQVGTVTYDICDATARNDLSFLAKSFEIDPNNADKSLNINATNPVATGEWCEIFRVGTQTDLNNTSVGNEHSNAYISVRKDTNNQAYGNFGLLLRDDADNSRTWNNISFRINNDKTREITVSDPTAWRKALGLGTTAPGTVLWSGKYYMTAGQTINLNANISTCPSGVVLHWQPYADGEALSYNHNYTFIPKNYPFAQGLCVMLIGNGMNNIGYKYIYIHNNQIGGNDLNDDTGTSSGITFNNKYWVLTQVTAV